MTQMASHWERQVDDDLGEAGNGDGGDDFGHPMGDQKEDDHEEPGDGGELADDDDQNINDPGPSRSGERNRVPCK